MRSNWRMKGGCALKWRANAQALVCKREKQSLLLQRNIYLSTLPVSQLREDLNLAVSSGAGY